MYTAMYLSVSASLCMFMYPICIRLKQELLTHESCRELQPFYV